MARPDAPLAPPPFMARTWDNPTPLMWARDRRKYFEEPADSAPSYRPLDFLVRRKNEREVPTGTGGSDGQGGGLGGTQVDKRVIDTIIAEALGEGDAGMTAVAYTILNRSKGRGLTPLQVVKQPNQYTGYSNPGSAVQRAMSDPQVRARVEAIWNKVQTGAVPDPTQGGQYFHTASISPSWSKGVNKNGTTQVGNHVFYLGKGQTNPVAPDVPPRRPETATAAIETALGIPPAPPSVAAYAPTVAPPAPPVPRIDQQALSGWLDNYQRTLGPAPGKQDRARPSRFDPPELTTRSVQTVPIDPMTGSVAPRFDPATDPNFADLRNKWFQQTHYVAENMEPGPWPRPMPTQSVRPEGPASGMPPALPSDTYLSPGGVPVYRPSIEATAAPYTGPSLESLATGGVLPPPFPPSYSAAERDVQNRLRQRATTAPPVTDPVDALSAQAFRARPPMPSAVPPMPPPAAPTMVADGTNAFNYPGDLGRLTPDPDGLVPNGFVPAGTGGPTLGTAPTAPPPMPGALRTGALNAPLGAMTRPGGVPWGQKQQLPPVTAAMNDTPSPMIPSNAANGLFEAARSPGANLLGQINNGQRPFLGGLLALLTGGQGQQQGGLMNGLGSLLSGRPQATNQQMTGSRGETFFVGSDGPTEMDVLLHQLHSRT